MVDDLDSEIQDERNRRWDQPFGKELLEGKVVLPMNDDTVEQILSLPDFADLSPGDFPAWLPLKGIIANDGRLRRYRKGEVIVRKGDYGNSLFVILEGEVVGLASAASESKVLTGTAKSRASWWRTFGQLLARRTPPEYRKNRPVDHAEELSSDSRMGKLDPSQQVDVDDVLANHPNFKLKAPQMFGELAALTRSPRTVSIFAAQDDTLLFELRWQGLREIRDWSVSFRQKIDDLYHDRGLAAGLRDCPVFAHVDQDAIDEIARHSLFETYGKFDWTNRFKSEIGKQGTAENIIDQEPLICEQGGHVDGLLLINSGFARVTEYVDHGQKTIGHLSRNDTFGLEEIAEADEHGGTTLKSSLHAIGYVNAIRIPTNLVRKHVLPGLSAKKLRLATSSVTTGGREEMRQGLMDFVVDHRFINGEKAMLINLDKCVGCDDCVRACSTAHYNNPRFARHGHTFENAMVVNACMHCTDPVCLIGCPTGAIHRAEDTGIVVIKDTTCIGCETCANSCPYNNIRMVDIRDESGAYMLDRDGHPISRATKCDLCADQLTGPACVQACPHEALTRINIRDTESLLRWLG